MEIILGLTIIAGAIYGHWRYKRWKMGIEWELMMVGHRAEIKRINEKFVRDMEAIGRELNERKNS